MSVCEEVIGEELLSFVVGNVKIAWKVELRLQKGNG